MSVGVIQAREEILAAAHRLMSGRIDDRGPGPHDDAEAEYSEEMLLAAASKLVRAHFSDSLSKDEEPISREEELLRRLAAAFATKATFDRGLAEGAIEDIPDDSPLSQLPSFLSALDHALAGTKGCLESSEWQVGRRANAIAYLAASVAPLPDPATADLTGMSMIKVAGVCPMGCGETLFLGAGSAVTCALATCPNPSAASEKLSAAAAEQAADEAVAATTERFETEARLEAMGSLVAVLLVQLKGQWWLKAAAAYQGLDRLVNGGEDQE